jgi:signal transduction histidine kinase/DNA-binding response OmpR family regulator
LYFSKLIVNNQTISANDSTGILRTAMPYTDSISLNAQQNNIVFEFAISDYSPGLNNVFEYKITGLNEQWMPIFDNRVTLVNVPHGVYLLEIRPVQASIVGNSAALSIVFEIRPPFYASAFAFVIYALFIVGVALSIFKINKTKTRLKLSIEFERKEKEKTKQLNNSKLEFFTNISHEFRTPLSLIKGHVDLLTQDNSLKRPEAVHVHKIMKQTVLLQNLTEELLDFHKYESGFGHLSVGFDNLVDLVREIFLSHKTSADKKEIDFSFHAPADKLLLYFDAAQLQKVIINIVSNALKYTPEKGFVRILLVENVTDVMVSVQDSGCGISENELPRVFDRYYQAPNQASKGFGIGLALAKRVVELHQGVIELKSQPGKGSTFNVRLKKGSDHFAGLPNVTFKDLSVLSVKVPDESFFSEVKSQLPESNIAPNILIVEDNQDLLDLLVEIMSPMYQVRMASDGEQGWQMCKEHLPDLVLTDLLMPKMSGNDLCKCIKSNFETSHIPVVILTAIGSTDKSIESMMFGADEYVKKPFDAKMLIAKCNSLINNRILLRKKFLAEKQQMPPLVATSESDLHFISKMNEVIDKNLENESFVVDDIAKTIGLGRSRFYLKVKELTSLTPNEYLLKYKMQKAMELLQNNAELNISEIAFRVGFKSSRYFAKCFKDYYGVVPSAVRVNGNDNVLE